MLLNTCRIWWNLQQTFLFKVTMNYKKSISQKNIPLRTITPKENPLLIMYPQISQILNQILPSVTCQHVIEGPYALKLWLPPLWRQKNKDFSYLPDMQFPQKLIIRLHFTLDFKADHMKNISNYFQTQKLQKLQMSQKLKLKRKMKILSLVSIIL